MKSTARFRYGAAVARRPRAYSPVNVIGRVLSDATQVRAVAGNTPVHLARCV